MKKNKKQIDWIRSIYYNFIGFWSFAMVLSMFIMIKLIMGANHWAIGEAEKYQTPLAFKVVLSEGCVICVD